MSRIYSEQEIIEQLADKEHASWARWMDYLFSCCDGEVIGDPDGVSIPGELVRAWKRQAATPYADLSEREKQSDRDEVAHILPIIAMARQAELYRAMVTVENLGGCSPEQTNTIVALGDRKRELDAAIDDVPARLTP